MIRPSGRFRSGSHPQLRAVRYFRSLSGRLDPLVSNAQVSMFTQDIPLAVVPYRTAEYEAKIVGPEAEVRRAVALFQTIGRESGRKTSDLVGGVIRELAQNLAWYGSVAYEIWKDENTVGLSLFTPQRLFQLPKYFIQIVPKADREECGRRIVLLPREIVWKISIPNLLGGHSGYRRTLRRLARFDSIAPSFWRNELGQGGLEKSSFNFMEYRREIDIYQARATRKWGWNGRDNSVDKRTEFALFYRLITFKWAQSTLREHILNELNLLLKRLEIGAAVQLSGLVTSVEILRLREEMVAGTIPYAKALEATKI
jgi:hypothetical protein